MNDRELYRPTDTVITSEDIPESHTHLNPTKAILMKDEITPGEYVSLVNQNNLSESIIYRRTEYRTVNNNILRWDGATKDSRWYDNNMDESILYVGNAEELAALSDLVAAGNDFSGKIIHLTSDINLNNKHWNPIGRFGDKRGVFRGTFNGDHHGIYNLTIIANDDRVDKEDVHFAFFDIVENAVIKDVFFERVHINDTRVVRGGVAAVCVDAVATTFIDVVVDGTMSGNKCAAIAVCAERCSFYYCINRSDIRGRSFCEKDNIVCGGFVATINVNKQIVGEPVLLTFNRCIQVGKISIKVLHNSGAVCIGQMYGRVRKYGDEGTAAVYLNRCSALENRVLINPETNTIDYPGYFGKVNSAAYGCNYVSPGHKADLLDGLIGATPLSVGVTVTKVTISVLSNGVVIPGSVNTLLSRPGIATFTTATSTPLGENDGVANITPYYTFIKRDTI